MDVPANATTALDPPVPVACYGANHHDRGQIVVHDRCGVVVARRDDGRLFDLFTVESWRRTYACWTAWHQCRPESVRYQAEQRAERVAAGELVKYATVRVVKGRKVPVGTVGQVVWIGEGFGKPRIGLRHGDQTVFIAAANVEVVREEGEQQ